MGWLANLFVRRGGPSRGTPAFDVQEAYLRFNSAGKDAEARSDAWDALGQAADRADAQDVLAAMVAIEENSGERYDAERLPKAVHELTIAIYDLKHLG